MVIGWRRTAAGALLVTVLAAGGASRAAAEPAVLGTRPAYSSDAPVDIPNAQATTARIWAPGLNDGYVPQGLALADGAVLVAGYHSTEHGEDRGPCRVFRVDPATGAVTGQFDVPADCGHAGGLATDGHGRLYVVDTHVVLAFDLATVWTAQNAEQALTQRLHLSGDVRGSLSTFHDGALWIGRWSPGLPGAIYRFPQQALLKLPREAKLTVQQAAQQVEIPARAQGAAFDGQGRLWVSLSNTRRGRLAVVDPANGKVLATYDTSPGVEGLAFADATHLWAVCEVGSQRWFHGFPFHPVVFALDTAVLKAE